MEILKKELKERSITIKTSNADDLWHLDHIIEEGDLIKAKTTRKITMKRGDTSESGEKKQMVLTIEAEKKNLDSTLRITGKIKEGPEDVEHGYHTLSIEPGSVVTIIKSWKKYQLERLEKAKIRKPLLFICVLDREEADFASLRESGINYLVTINPKSPEDIDREDYYKEIMKYLKRQKFETIIVAGPGFERENVFNYIKENDAELAKKIIVEHASNTGRPGIQEIIKKSSSRILKDSRIAREASYVEEFLKRIKTDGLVIYGIKQVEKAVEYGAVETLLVSLDKIRGLEKMMETVEKQDGKIVIISNDHELGEQFAHLGGIGAFLRFKIE